MSLGSRVAALEREVAELRTLVARLSAQLEESEGSSFDIVPASSPTAPLPRPLNSSPSAASSRSPAAFSPHTRAPAPASSSAAGAAGTTPSSRGAACREIGLFLRRCLNGEHRGASGRDRLPGGSRFWVVAKDYHGCVLSPVQVLNQVC